MSLYNPQHQVLMIGNTVITGWADTDFLTIERPGADSSLTEGPDGSMKRSVMSNRKCEVKITLMAGTAAHKALMTLRETQRVNPLGPDMIFSYVDTDFRESWNGTVAFESVPGVKAGKEKGDHEWSFSGPLECAVL